MYIRQIDKMIINNYKAILDSKTVKNEQRNLGTIKWTTWKVELILFAKV